MGFYIWMQDFAWGQDGSSRGVTFIKIVCECECQTSKIWLSVIYQFFAQYPPTSVPFMIENHPTCPNWVFVTIFCSKHTQFLNLGSSVSDENPPIAIPNFMKKHLNRQAHYVCTMSIWELPRGTRNNTHQPLKESKKITQSTAPVLQMQSSSNNNSLGLVRLLLGLAQAGSRFSFDIQVVMLKLQFFYSVVCTLLLLQISRVHKFCNKVLALTSHYDLTLLSQFRGKFRGTERLNRDFAFFVFERTKHQPRRNLRSYLVLQRLCNEVALSPGIDAFWY